MVLLGPSGCGKTTLLRSIAGLEEIDAGSVIIGDRDVTEMPPRNRKISMVFQNYAVFPHLTVFENIAFGLRMQKRPDAEVTKKVQEVAEQVHLESMLQRYSGQLSGGQRQRVALARALAVEPSVILMDEPLSNLDALLRLEMRAELKTILSKSKTTTIYVTHDQVEAMSLADRIAIMNQGVIVQCDTPLEIYRNPATTFVAGFIGNPPMNFVSAQIARDGDALTAGVEGAGSVKVDAAHVGLLRDYVGKPVLLGIRAANIEVVEEAVEGDTLKARVLVVEPLGSHQYLLTAKLGRELLKVAAPPDRI